MKLLSIQQIVSDNNNVLDNKDTNKLGIGDLEITFIEQKIFFYIF